MSLVRQCEAEPEVCSVKVKAVAWVVGASLWRFRSPLMHEIILHCDSGLGMSYGFDHFHLYLNSELGKG